MWTKKNKQISDALAKARAPQLLSEILESSKMYVNKKNFKKSHTCEEGGSHL